MPWESSWVPAPSDPSLPVLAELPEGVAEWPWPDDPRRAHGGGRRFYHCKRCGGWIEGNPTEYRVDTLAPLSGRRGVETYCIRCGEEIAFSGMVS
jgi:hypothetical protein